MPLALEIPTFFLEGGPTLKHAKGYYLDLLQAQRIEVEGSLGRLMDAPASTTDTAWVAELPTPSVLVLPALCGGWVEKRWWAWYQFCEHLRQYRAAGGVVVCLDKAFNLPADGRQARGRAWRGFGTDSKLPGLSGTVELVHEDGTLSVDSQGLKVWSEWKRSPKAKDGLARSLAWVRQGEAHVDLAWIWSRPGWDEPGVMLFLSSWGWARRDVLNNRKWTRGAHTQGVIEQVSSGYRGLNRELVRAAVLAVLQRRAERTARLERLAGETVRLPGRTGREKDYHRLLVNDVELCVDIVGWRDLVGVCDASAAFRRTFVKPGVVNEPGYAKTRGRGRLDILLSADPAAEGRKELWLATPERGPVAWIELEAGGIHLHQIQEFIQGHGEHLQPGDYVCAIDQSPDDHPQVAEARGFVEAAGATFLHSQVPNAFSRLEEAYAPGMHRLSRKRYTLEVIRGLLS